jgi:ribosomal protein S18 acetylase RimI-like enzyme
LRRLEQVCFGGDAWPLWDLAGLLIFPGLVRIKAVCNGEMVGFAGGDPHPSEGTGWVATIAVFPAYRRKGIASALLRACEEAMGLPAVRLSVRRSNDAAAALYHREGYRLVDIWPRYYFDGEDAMVLEKRCLK